MCIRDRLGKGLATICYVLNPDTIVLGGGVMAQKKILENEIIDSLKRYLKPVSYTHLDVYKRQVYNIVWATLFATITGIMTIDKRYLDKAATLELTGVKLSLIHI